MPRSLTLAIVTASLCLAAEGGASITPAPGFEAPAPAVAQPHSMRPGMMVPRMLPAFEVETLTVKTGDAASLSAWVELAGQGYHVVGTAPVAGGVELYLERAANPAAGGAIQLPAALEQDKAAADALRAKVKQDQEERQKAMQAAMRPASSAPAPAVAPAPAPASSTK